jgi:hypothetical protein
MVRITIGMNKFILLQNQSNVVVQKEDRQVMIIKDIDLHEIATWEVAKYLTDMEHSDQDTIHLEGEQFR